MTAEFTSLAPQPPALSLQHCLSVCVCECVLEPRLSCPPPTHTHCPGELSVADSMFTEGDQRAWHTLTALWLNTSTVTDHSSGCKSGWLSRHYHREGRGGEGDLVGGAMRCSVDKLPWAKVSHIYDLWARS